MLVTRIIGVGVPRALLVFFELEGVSREADDANPATAANPLMGMEVLFLNYEAALFIKISVIFQIIMFFLLFRREVGVHLDPRSSLLSH